MKASELADRITSRRAPTVIDARSGMEFHHGHIPGAIHAPLLEILLKRARLPDNKGSELVITCEHGPRALMAKCLLGTCGYGNTTLLEGHMLGWRKAGLPLEEKGQRLKKVSYGALDCKVTLSDDSLKRLSSFWSKRPVALVFPRHFGCPFGRRQVVQLCREQVRFAHVSANAADHPSPLEIIQAAATLKPGRARTRLAKSRPTPRTAAVPKRQRRPGRATARESMKGTPL